MLDLLDDDEMSYEGLDGEILDIEDDDPFSDEEDWEDDEDWWDDEDPDEWLKPLAAVASVASPFLGQLYADHGSKRLRDSKYSKRFGLTRKKKKGKGREFTRLGSVVDNTLKYGLPALGSIAGLLAEDADPFEPEYETDQIDRMEALVEDALDEEGDATDAALAADEMVSLSFGMMRGSRALRPIMARLAREVRMLIARARRDPRLRQAARLAPLALRRTAVILMRMAVARRRVTLGLAVGIFRRILAGLLRSGRSRRAGLQRARMRANRYRARRGYSRPQMRRIPRRRSSRRAYY